MQHSILIAEDNIELSDVIRDYLLQAGYRVFQAFDGQQAVDFARKLSPSLILLDIMMPVLDGYQVCGNIRLDLNIPIIVISAKEAEKDKLKLFDLGADDYLTKPFSIKEMAARVAAQLRRHYKLNKQPIQGNRTHGRLFISPKQYEAKVDDKLLNLTAKEFKMLDFLTENTNQIFSKQQLMDAVWGANEFLDENTIAVTVARLREKLLKQEINNIATVWGLGYKWQD